MRPPATIKKWISIEKMFQWLQQAPDETSHKRRMAIWLTHTGRLHANKVAEILGVSTQAIWLWIRQYNEKGPEGLNRKGRGGRRWAFMSQAKEIEFLRPFIRRAKNGDAPKADEIKAKAEKFLNRKLTKPYIYRLLHRHGWEQILAQSKSDKHPSPSQDDFTSIARPWHRST